MSRKFEKNIQHEEWSDLEIWTEESKILNRILRNTEEKIYYTFKFPEEFSFGPEGKYANPDIKKPISTSNPLLIKELFDLDSEVGSYFLKTFQETTLLQEQYKILKSDVVDLNKLNNLINHHAFVLEEKAYELYKQNSKNTSLKAIIHLIKKHEDGRPKWYKSQLTSLIHSEFQRKYKDLHSLEWDLLEHEWMLRGILMDYETKRLDQLLNKKE